MASLHARLRAALFETLYHSRTLYWLASTIPFAGQWRVWQRLVLPHLRGHSILEIGCGTGDLLADMVIVGYTCVGLDRSPQMVAATRATLRRRMRDHTRNRPHAEVPTAAVYRSSAQELPFARETFDTVVSTFPSDYIYDPAVLREVARVLRPGGRLIVLEGACLLPATLWQRILLGLQFLVYGGAAVRGPYAFDGMTPGALIPLETAGLMRRTEQVTTPRWIAFLTIGEKPAINRASPPSDDDGEPLPDR